MREKSRELNIRWHTAMLTLELAIRWAAKYKFLPHDCVCRNSVVLFIFSLMNYRKKRKKKNLDCWYWPVFSQLNRILQFYCLSYLQVFHGVHRWSLHKISLVKAEVVELCLYKYYFYLPVLAETTNIPILNTKTN